jgi:hypothetical protein
MTNQREEQPMGWKPELPERWRHIFDDRQQKHIRFCVNYEKDYAHGAPGHLDMLVIAKLTDCLVDAQTAIHDLERQVAGVKSVETVANKDVRELLAAYAHEAWSGWMKYLWNKCDDIDAEGTIRIPNWAVARWDRQMNTPYADLPESEKQSDRDEADRMLAIVEACNA